VSHSTRAAYAAALGLLLSAESPAQNATHREDSPDGTFSRSLDTVRIVSERPDAYEVDTTVTAGKMPIPIMHTPQAVTVVPEQMLRDFRPVFLDDALRTVSGVNQDNTFGNTADGFTLRGFFADRIFRNGVRTLSSRALTPSTDRIEVLKGPASLLYGSIEPGGLVNVTTRRPRFDATGLEVGYQASDRGGSRANLDATGPIGNAGGADLAFRVIADLDRSDYWRNFGEYDDLFVSPSLSLRSEKLRATLAYERYDRDDPFDRGTVVVGDTIADIPQTRRLGESFERLTELTNLVELDLEYDLAESTMLRFRATYQDSEGDDLQARPRRVTTDAQGNVVLVRRVDGTFGRYGDTTYFSTNLLHRMGTGRFDHTILAGVDREETTDGRDGFVQGPDESVANALEIFNPVYGTLDRASATPIDEGRFEGTKETTGFYLQDLVSFGAGWHVVLGGRYERFESFSLTEGRTLPDDDSSGNTFLPRAGVVYQPREWISFYASYSESFQPNTVSPSSLAPGAPTSFDPQQGVSYETGLKVERGGVRLNAAVFDINKQNVLLIENQVPRLIDTATSRGFELDVGGNLSDGTSLMASYAYVDSDDGEGHTLTNVAKHTIGAALSHRWTHGTLQGASAGISVQYVGDRDGGSNPSASPGGPEFFTVPSYTLVDLFAAYDWQTSFAPVRLQLNLKNAFDEVYFPSSGGSLRVNPGQIRTVYGSMSVRF
jgi:iron complex outermembrane receptor protein